MREGLFVTPIWGAREGTAGIVAHVTSDGRLVIVRFLVDSRELLYSPDELVECCIRS